METATEVKDVLVPINESNGWLIFRYGSDDKDPCKWPKVLKYRDRYYKWMSWNSDSYHVNYKQINQNDLATIIRKR